MLRVYLSLVLFFAANIANATVSSVNVPLDESKSAPAVDLIENGTSVDQGVLIEQIKHGFDTSVLEPQLSDPYQGVAQPTVQYANMPYPRDGETVNFDKPLDGVSGLVRGRVTLENNDQVAYQLNFSLDTHAALSRNALMRKLGYAIPSPRYYSHLKVRFHDLDERNSFIEGLGGDTLTARERWVDGGQTEVDGKDLVVHFHDLVLEPAIVLVPQLHWGILTPETINGRRSIRALLLPLTLLDISESVNMYAYEPAKIYNEALAYTRVNADKFKNETSIGDVKWLAKKMVKFSRADWAEIVHAGHYPLDLEALILEKTLGRVDQQMKLLQIIDFNQIPYNSYVNIGKVVNGKATQEFYDGYALRFAYGDPQNPLRASEIGRFFSIEALNGGLGYYIDKANDYLQVLTPTKYIDEHSNDFTNELTDHFANHPDQPFIQPLSVFGGVTGGANISADRSIVTGTYYGSDSQVQLVDSLSASVNVGGFVAVSGITKFGLSMKPSVSYTRSYVHVRPLTDIKSAFKDNWAHLFVPGFMSGLAKVLQCKDGVEAKDALKNFMEKMKTGESFIITDGFSSGVGVDAKIPLGANMGLISPFSSLSSDITLDTQYTLLSRVTLYKTDDGIQVYLSRINSGSIQFEITADYYVHLIDQAWVYSRGGAHTKAYTFPDSFENDSDSSKTKIFQNALIQILRKNNPNEMEASFDPYTLDHQSSGNRRKLTIGPWQWSKRENMHKLEITPPKDTRYDNSQFKRTVFSGQTTKISGKDLFGFFSGILKSFYSFVNLGGNAKGDDPSANFLGNSQTLVADTEIETTPGRTNQPFTKLQFALNGWIMKKPTLLKAIEKISTQIGEFNPSGGLIDPSEFAQTKKIQAYTILWNLLIYEKGAKRVMDILNVNVTSTKDAFNFLVNLMGEAEYTKYCTGVGLKPILQNGPFANDKFERTRMESSQGQVTYIGCTPKLLDAAFDLRASLASHPEVFNTDVRTDDAAKSKIKWTNNVFMKLNDHLELAQLIRWIGKENSFFQVRVSGFRTNDENADFKSAYYSNTVGLIDQTVLGGPMSDIEDVTKISSHEVEARYLSNGY